MAPVEFHRYTDTRGDTIIYKFDPDIACKSNPASPNDSAVSVYHHYIINKCCTVNYHSDFLPLDLAMDRWRNDKQSSQPIIGMVMYKEDAHAEDGSGAQLKTQYIWKGWAHGEGYRRGWAKLEIRGLDGSKRVFVVQRDKGKGPAEPVLEPTPRAKVVAPIGERKRKDSKDLQELKEIYAMEVKESSKAIEDRGDSQNSNRSDLLADLPDKQQPQVEMKGGMSELPNAPEPPIKRHEKDEDEAASTPNQKPNKRENRKGKKGKKDEVEYTVDSPVPIIAPEYIPSDAA